MYLVSGVTGNTGKVVASDLLEEGKPVRVIVRTKEKGEFWRARGAEVAVTSLDDTEGLLHALNGVKAFYVVLPTDMESCDLSSDYRRYSRAIANALAIQPIERGVYLSAWGTHRPDGPFQMHRETEVTLGNLRTPFTIIRTAFFMENISPLLASIQEDGVLSTFFEPTYKVPMVAIRDIAEVIVSAMLGKPQPPATIELTGPTEYSMQDVTTVLSNALQIGLRVERVPLKEVASSLVGDGASEEVGEFYRNTIEAFEQNRVTPEGGSATFVRGHVTLEQFAAQLLSPTNANRAYLQ